MSKARSDRRPEPSPAVALGSTIRVGWKLFSSRWASLTGLFLAIYVPLFLLRGIALRALAPDGTSDVVAATVFVGIEFVLPALAGAVAVAAAAVMVVSRGPEHDVSIGQALSSLSSSSREVVSAGMVAVMLAMASFFAGLHQLLLPLFFGPPILIHVIALEGRPFREAWGRMKELLKGNWARAVLYLLIVALGISVVHNLALVGLFYLLDARGAAEETVSFLLGGPVAGVTRGLTLPLLASVATGLYLLLGERAPAPGSE